jgi:hypothetical protein
MDSNMLGSITSSNHQATLATLHRHGPIKSTSWSPFAPKTGLAIGWVDQVRQCAQGGWDLCSGESKVFSFWILDIFFNMFGLFFGVFFFFGSFCWLMFSCFFCRSTISYEGRDYPVGMTWEDCLGWKHSDMTSLVLLNDKKKMYQTEPKMNPKLILKNHDSLWILESCWNCIPRISDFEDPLLNLHCISLDTH